MFTEWDRGMREKEDRETIFDELRAHCCAAVCSVVRDEIRAWEYGMMFLFLSS
jgi:hypothetical protein